MPSMGERARILIIEDEAPIRRGVCDLLAFHGFAPVGVGDGDEGLRMALVGGYDLLIVDVRRPGVDGFTICERVRGQRPGQAILMLTAKGREEVVLEGFRRGCDDYISKPFSLAQLVARVQALVRRAAASRPRHLELGAVSVDLDNLRARAGEGEVDITPRDAEVLSYLSRERHRVVSRADLLREVWGYQRVDGVETRCVDMHMVKLRRKIARVAPEHGLIETVRGAGYRLRPR